MQQKKLIYFFVFFILLNIGGAFATLNDGLVAYYPFNGNADDESGNQNNGVENNVSLAEDQFGNIDQAFYFNGNNSFIQVSNSNSLHLTNVATIAAWIYIDIDTNYEIYDYRHIVSKGAVYGQLCPDYAIGLSNPDGNLQWDTSSNEFVKSEEIITQGMWNHVAVVFANQTVNFFLNGKLIKSSDGSLSNIIVSSQPLYIGARYKNPVKGSFKGKIDEVRIYNRNLSLNEIKFLYYGECTDAYQQGYEDAKQFYLSSMYTEEQLDQAILKVKAADEIMITQLKSLISSMYTQEQLDTAIKEAKTGMFSNEDVNQMINKILEWDIDNDGTIGLIEAIQALKNATGIKPFE
jgi:hypothetical protein